MSVFLLTITVVAVVVAAVATFRAWQVTDEQRRRSEARVAALAAAVTAADRVQPAPVHVAHLLEPVASGGRQRAVALAGTVGLLLLLVVLSFGQLATGRALAESASPAAAPAAAPGAPPVELTALGHRRAGGGLELRGEVHGAPAGAPLNRMTAVALLFDNQGTFIGSGRAPLQLRSLDDATRATFVVALPDADRVGRYRISFRDGDRIVPHVDRRGVR